MRWLLLVLSLLLGATAARADSNVPALTAGTSLTNTVIYGAQGGTLDRKFGLDTALFGVSAGNITLNSGSITNGFLAAGSFGNITGVGTLGSLTVGGTLSLGTNTLSGNFTASGVPKLTGLSVGTQVSCLGLDSANSMRSYIPSRSRIKTISPERSTTRRAPVSAFRSTSRHIR